MLYQAGCVTSFECTLKSWMEYEIKKKKRYFPLLNSVF